MVQVPQAPSLQPSLTEVRCSSSRRKRISFWFCSTVTAVPLTKNVAMGTPPPLSRPGRDPFYYIVVLYHLSSVKQGAAGVLDAEKFKIFSYTDRFLAILVALTKILHFDQFKTVKFYTFHRICMVYTGRKMDYNVTNKKVWFTILFLRQIYIWRKLKEEHDYVHQSWYQRVCRIGRMVFRASLNTPKSRSSASTTVPRRLSGLHAQV